MSLQDWGYPAAPVPVTHQHPNGDRRRSSLHNVGEYSPVKMNIRGNVNSLAMQWTAMSEVIDLLGLPLTPKKDNDQREE